MPKSSDGCYDAPQTVSTRDRFADDASTSDRPYDGGSGAPSFVRTVEQAVDWAPDRPGPPTREAPGGEVREGVAQYSGT